MDDLFKLKIKLFKASVLSVLLYGCESWVLTQALTQTLEALQNQCLRIMFGIDRNQHVTNEAVLQQTGESPLSDHVKERQLRFLGHCLRRHPNDLIAQHALYTPKHGRQSRGRPWSRPLRERNQNASG